MFRKTRSEKFIEQAQSLANDMAEALAPKVSQAKEHLGPRVAEAREQFAPRVDEARNRIANDVIPAVQQALNDAKEQAREQAGPAAEEAKRRGIAATAALKGEAVVEPKKSRGKRLLLLIGLAGIAAFVAKKLQAQNSSSANWQPSTPAPAPAAPATNGGSAQAATSNGVAGGAHAATRAEADLVGDDSAGAAPDEALADASEEPHAVTTPDDPAEVVDLSELPDPDRK